MVKTDAAGTAKATVKIPEAQRALKVFDPTGGKLTPAAFIRAPLPRTAKKRMESPAPIASDR